MTDRMNDLQERVNAEIAEREQRTLEVNDTLRAELAEARAQVTALKTALADALDEWESWMSVAGMDGADQPAPEDFTRLKAARAVLGGRGS